jgi:hypothetical protein
MRKNFDDFPYPKSFRDTVNHLLTETEKPSAPFAVLQKLKAGFRHMQQTIYRDGFKLDSDTWQNLSRMPPAQFTAFSNELRTRMREDTLNFLISQYPDEFSREVLTRVAAHALSRPNDTALHDELRARFTPKDTIASIASDHDTKEVLSSMKPGEFSRFVFDMREKTSGKMEKIMVRDWRKTDSCTTSDLFDPAPESDYVLLKPQTDTRKNESRITLLKMSKEQAKTLGYQKGDVILKTERKTADSRHSGKLKR